MKLVTTSRKHCLFIASKRVFLRFLRQIRNGSIATHPCSAKLHASRVLNEIQAVQSIILPPLQFHLFALTLVAALTLNYTRDHAGAIEASTQRISRGTKDADTFLAAGRGEENLGHYTLALDDYDKAIRLNPKCIEMHITRGLLRSQLGDRKGAIQDFNEIIAIDPSNPFGFRNRGHERNLLGDYQRALADYNQALQLTRLQASLPSFLAERALIRLELGDKSGAADDANKSIKLRPRCNFIGYYARGLTRLKTGDTTAAKKDLQRIPETAPDFARAKQALDLL